MRSLGTWALLAVAACGASPAPIIDAAILDGTADGEVADAADPDGPEPSDASSDGADLDAVAPVDAAAVDAEVPVDAAAVDAVVPLDAAPGDAAVPVDSAIADAVAPTPFFLGPTPYLTAADAPWRPADFTAFVLEDFEDGTLDAPGLTASAYMLSSTFGPSRIDSVDGDDGAVNGACGGCEALWAGGTVTFTFSPTEPGGLPTAVGLVWTDGGPGSTVVFEAFAADGAPLGSVTGAGFADDSNDGGTAEDRFFGVRYSGGVGSIRVGNTTGGIEIDHLQYGR